MLVYVTTKEQKPGTEEYIDVACSRNRAEKQLRGKYPNMKCINIFEGRYVSDDSDKPEILFIRGRKV